MLMGLISRTGSIRFHRRTAILALGTETKQRRMAYVAVVAAQVFDTQLYTRPDPLRRRPLLHGPRVAVRRAPGRASTAAPSCRGPG
ncbi:hypothetical protein MES5069_160053 [Mesorhizobium escarrei]|uniref:Uncharacterized protein n=1 Tax=Mesorhizobium escarrei TaxID=666018 RepID=A0ABM9DKD8_9HYPH|nr:hypothetical protein MES5069_160053 [Mesorhizobium escarrei]